MPDGSIRAADLIGLLKEFSIPRLTIYVRNERDDEILMQERGKDTFLWMSGESYYALVRIWKMYQEQKKGSLVELVDIARVIWGEKKAGVWIYPDDRVPDGMIVIVNPRDPHQTHLAVATPKFQVERLPGTEEWPGRDLFFRPC